MKILKLDEFLKLPAGTWFCEADKLDAPLSVKEQSLDYGDFFFIPIVGNTNHQLNGDFLTFTDAFERWGGCDPSAEFLVLEEKEIVALRSFVNAKDPTEVIGDWINSGQSEQRLE